MPDRGLWKETIDPVTGESSLSDHHLKTVWLSCPPNKCVFELTNSAKRECTCTKCGRVVYFILGNQILKDGQIISLKPKL